MTTTAQPVASALHHGSSSLVARHGHACILLQASLAMLMSTYAAALFDTCSRVIKLSHTICKHMASSHEWRLRLQATQT